jgi:hypothetical protein
VKKQQTKVMIMGEEWHLLLYDVLKYYAQYKPLAADFCIYADL